MAAFGIYFCLCSAGAAENLGDARLVDLTYKKNQVFQVKVKKNTATHIILESGEHIISSATGFPSDCKKEDNDWCVVANVGDHALFVKPKNHAQGTNNLELTTDKRIYSLELSTVRELGGETPMYRVTFQYPETQSVKSVAKYAGPWEWDYTMQQLPGSAAIVPALAFDDGRHTHLKFAIQSVLPAVFAVGANGVEQRLPVRINEEGLVVLDRVVGDVVLRHDGLAVRIWKGRPEI